MSGTAPLLLVAMTEEARAFPSGRRRAGHRELEVAGLDHRLVFSGPGPENALAALEDREPSSVLQVGFAGALRPEIAAGELFRIATVRLGPEVLEAGSSPAAAALTTLPPARLVTAPAPLGARDKATMSADDAGDLVDMESAHVLRACRERGIPWAGLRVVSDTLAEDLPDCLAAAWDGRRFHLAPILRAFLVSARARRDLLALRRRARLCSEVLARFLFPS